MSNELPTFDELLQRDADKIEEIKKVVNGRKKSKVEPEWLLIAEFGLYFGWQAVLDVRNDVISFGEMNKMLAATRSIKATERYNRVIDAYAASIALHDKGKALKQTLNGIRDTINE